MANNYVATKRSLSLMQLAGSGPCFSWTELSIVPVVAFVRLTLLGRKDFTRVGACYVRKQSLRGLTTSVSEKTRVYKQTCPPRKKNTKAKRGKVTVYKTLNQIKTSKRRKQIKCRRLNHLQR